MSRIVSLKAVCLSLILFSGTAYAQIGPNLRPPALPETESIETLDSEFYGEDSMVSLVDGWDLNTENVVFSASKKRQLLSEAPSTIHVITDKDIAAYGWRSLSEILRQVPGIQTMTTRSQFNSVMIRGLVGTEANNSRILWLQNGVPLNDVRDAGLWMDDSYPVELIKRIEIVLGPGSALYGSGAFQGVVNIFTKDAKDIPKFGSYAVGLGANNTMKASAMAAYYNENKSLGFMLSATANHTQGPSLIADYVYNTDSLKKGGQNVSQAQNSTARRADEIKSNSDRTWFNVYAKGTLKDFRLSLSYNEVRSGFDGAEYQPFRDFRFNRRDFSGELLYEKVFSDKLSILAVTSYRFQRYGYKKYGDLYQEKISKIPVTDFFGGTGSSTDNPGYPQDIGKKVSFDSNQHKVFAVGQLQWKIIPSNELIVGLGLEYDGIDAPEFVPGKRNLNFITPSVFVQDEQRFFSDRLILTAGARFDYYKVNDEDRNAAPSWRAAVLVKWHDKFTQRLSYGHAFKEPSIYQLYADHIDYRGNSRLKPETLENVELSNVVKATASLTLRLDAYFSHMKDLIIVDYNTNNKMAYLGYYGFYVPRQNNSALITGFEFSTSYKITRNFMLYAHYNFLYGILRNKNKSKDRIPDDAMHRATLGFNFNSEYANANLSTFFVSATPKTESLFRHLSQEGSGETAKYSNPMYFIVQPHITVRLPADFGLTLQAGYALSKGMTKAPSYKYYYEMRGIPVPRFNAFVALSYPFQGRE